MNRLSGLLVLSLALGGCKDGDKLPEHVVQQRRKQTEREQRREELKRETEHVAKTRDAGVDHYRMWSPEVRKAFYALYRSRSQGIPEKARRLVQHGLVAADALRAIAVGKHHSPKKKALVSFMLVDLHMFRVDDLAQMAREPTLPFLQRAAVEALARIGSPESEATLDKLIKELPGMPLPALQGQRQGDGHGHGHGHGHGSPSAAPDDDKKEPPPTFPPGKHPVVLWVKSIRRAKRAERWAYSRQQLKTLDDLLHAVSPPELRAAVNAVKGDSLERGLRAMLSSPVTRPSVQAGVAFRLVEPHRKSGRALRKLCGADEHHLVRMQAARTLLERNKPADRAFVIKLAKNPQDPVAPMLQRMLRQAPKK